MRLASVPFEEGTDAGSPVSDVCEPAAAAAPKPLPGGTGLPVRGDPGWATTGRGRTARSGGGRPTPSGRAPALGERGADQQDLRRDRVQPSEPVPLADALRGGWP